MKFDFFLSIKRWLSQFLAFIKTVDKIFTMSESDKGRDGSSLSFGKTFISKRNKKKKKTDK